MFNSSWTTSSLAILKLLILLHGTISNGTGALFNSVTYTLPFLLFNGKVVFYVATVISLFRQGRDNLLFFSVLVVCFVPVFRRRIARLIAPK